MIELVFYPIASNLSGPVTAKQNLSDVKSLGDFLCIPTPDTGQLNPLFYTLQNLD